nr:AAA family ATPase [Chloroflexota bacterium]
TELRAGLDARRAARAEQRADLAGRRSTLQGRQSLLARLVDDLARTARAHETAEQRLAMAQHTEQVQARTLSELSAESAVAIGRIDELERTCSALRAERRRIREERSELERRAAEPRAASRAQRTLLEAHSIDESRATDRLERLRREAEEYFEELGVSVARVAIGTWEQGRFDDLACGDTTGDPSTAEPELPMPDPDATRRRMNVLRRELRAIGPVGDDALAELGELRDRHAFLVSQTADMDATVGELRGAMEELEGMMRTAFDEAFARVNAAFGEYFGRLFGGGHAELVLSRPDDVLETGVDIVARPPGKRLQPLVSLSGGERALTMVALIFGLLKTNPAPFCVLDEVDAALDEANVRRFTDMLQELSGRTQFIVVTHNRATMEIAQALYGISMGTDGVSTVVSLRLPD